MSKPLRRTAANNAAKAIDIGKIGKLMRVLGSDKSGEVLAAVAALGRVLETAGMDFHTLADAVADGLKPRKPARGTSWEPSDPDLLNWESMSWYCRFHSHHLRDDDREFIIRVLLGRTGFDLGRATTDLMHRLRAVVSNVKAARGAEPRW
jgi:hypothetical protein